MLTSTQRGEMFDSCNCRCETIHIPHLAHFELYLTPRPRYFLIDLPIALTPAALIFEWICSFHRINYLYFHFDWWAHFSLLCDLDELDRGADHKTAYLRDHSFICPQELLGIYSNQRSI